MFRVIQQAHEAGLKRSQHYTDVHARSPHQGTANFGTKLLGRPRIAVAVAVVAEEKVPSRFARMRYVDLTNEAQPSRQCSQNDRGLLASFPRFADSEKSPLVQGPTKRCRPLCLTGSGLGALGEDASIAAAPKTMKRRFTASGLVHSSLNLTEVQGGPFTQRARERDVAGLSQLLKPSLLLLVNSEGDDLHGPTNARHRRIYVAPRRIYVKPGASWYRAWRVFTLGSAVRVSEIYNLQLTQGQLDFVDVDVDRDAPLFIDPAALRRMQGDWARDSVALIQDFFQTVINAIREGNDDWAIELLSGLREPNETHLGFSSGKSRGRALGPGSAEDVWEALSRSEATRTGLLEHLEDTALLVYGIGPDIVSDIATNLMRAPLITYTQHMSDYYGIELEEGVATGPLWDPATSDWSAGDFEPLPIAGGQKLLLLPKVIVRHQLEYDADEYLNNYIIPYLEHQEIAAETELVRTIKYSGQKKVTKKDLAKKYGLHKDDVIRITLEAAGDTNLLDQYRRVREDAPARTLGEVDLANATGADITDWDELINAVRNVTPGPNGADAYHNAAERLITAAFAPSLSLPIKEYKIHDGRKRIDIAYANTGSADFFAWVAQHHPAANIFVECKNYSGDPGNPELDQLAGRFSPTRGTVGLLCCRSFVDKGLFVQRCRDTALDHRGFIIALDDEDLATIAGYRRDGQGHLITPFLKTRFDELT